MAEFEFLHQTVAHISYVKLFLLTGYSGIKGHMEEHIAQLLADVLRIVLHQGITQFKGFFYGVGAQTFVGLLLVPRALFAQRVEHIQKAPECRHLFFSCMHDYLFYRLLKNHDRETSPCRDCPYFLAIKYYPN